MLDALNSLCLSIMDLLLGWSLRLPRDLLLVGVALGTALLLTLVRLFTTDQGFLNRCRRDKARLKELVREAKARKDKDAVARHQATMRQAGMQALRSEGLPLLVSAPVIALLAVWCFSRIACLPPKPSEPVVVRAYFPVSSIGGLAHLVPQDGLTAETGWVRRVESDRDEAGSVVNGVAEWTLTCRGRQEPYRLTLRHEGATAEQDLLVDGLRYAPPVRFVQGGPIQAVETVLREYRPFGVLPGLGGLMIQPWLLGYLVVVLPLSFVLKPILGIR